MCVYFMYLAFFVDENRLRKSRATMTRTTTSTKATTKMAATLTAIMMEVTLLVANDGTVILVETRKNDNNYYVLTSEDANATTM